MNRLSHLLLDDSVTAFAFEPARPAQVEDGPAAALLHTLSFALWRISLSPMAVSVAERSAVRELVRDCRGSLAAFERFLAGRTLPADYEQDVVAGTLMLNR